MHPVICSVVAVTITIPNENSGLLFAFVPSFYFLPDAIPGNQVGMPRHTQDCTATVHIQIHKINMV